MTLLTIGGTLAVVGAVAGAYYFAMRPVTLRIAVGPPGSDDSKVVQTLTQSFIRDHAGVRLRPVSTEGATASATAIAEGKADLAIIRGDLDVPKNAMAVAILRKNVAVLWVPPQPKPATAAKTRPAKKSASKKEKDKDEGITKISQLSGKRIGVIGRTPANVNLLKTILSQYGLDSSKNEIVQFSTSEVGEAVRGQKVDAFIAAGPISSRITTEAINATSRDGEPTFLAIDIADALAQNHNVYEASEIPEGAFGTTPDRPDDEIKTISFAHYIVARRGLSDTTVALLTRQIFAARQGLVAEFPLAAKIETPDTDRGAVLQAHPGAAAYVDGEEKTFMDRYSDFIWFGIMGLSVIGSAGAWFASYLRRDERVTNTAQRDRLLDMMVAARHCTSWQELDAMQGEADSILRDTLACYENGVIEHGALTAFNIALEQFHNAVADRKSILAQLTEVEPVAPATAPVRAPRPAVA